MNAGLIPCAPYTPHVAFTVRVLETYRILHARCPQLAIQAYVKSLCDQHGVRASFIPSPFLCSWFSRSSLRHILGSSFRLPTMYTSKFVDERTSG